MTSAGVSARIFDLADGARRVIGGEPQRLTLSGLDPSADLAPLVIDRDDLLIIDPGADDPSE